MANVLYSTEKLRRVAEYVGQTQPALEKMAAQESAMKARIPGVVDALVTHGLLSPHLKAAKVVALENNPVEILDLLEKTAGLVTPKSVGAGEGKAVEKLATAAQTFEDRLMGNR